jgi:hypothetical protein
VLIAFDRSGTQGYVSDLLGSTLALTNTTGTLSTSGSYDPYGSATASGSASANTRQYTGRENDGATGLNYTGPATTTPPPASSSPNPAGSAGSGTNLYTYAGDSPANGPRIRGPRR